MAVDKKGVVVTVQICTEEKDHPTYVFDVDNVLSVPHIMTLVESERELRASYGERVLSATVCVLF